MLACAQTFFTYVKVDRRSYSSPCGWPELLTMVMDARKSSALLLILPSRSRMILEKRADLDSMVAQLTLPLHDKKARLECSTGYGVSFGNDQAECVVSEKIQSSVRLILLPHVPCSATRGSCIRSYVNSGLVSGFYKSISNT